MATRRMLGQQRETFKHNASITYDATKVGGSDHALGNFAVSMTTADTVGLVGDGQGIVGELLTVEEDGYCSVITSGQGLQFKQGAVSGVGHNQKIVGAAGDSHGGQTGGYVKSAGSDTDGRGLVTHIDGNTKGATVTVNFP